MLSYCVHQREILTSKGGVFDQEVGFRFNFLSQYNTLTSIVLCPTDFAVKTQNHIVEKGNVYPIMLKSAAVLKLLRNKELLKVNTSKFTIQNLSDRGKSWPSLI